MLLSHTMGIFTHPDQEWKAIRDDKESANSVFLSHIPLLALIPCVSAFIGVTQFGWSFGAGPINKLTVESAFTVVAISYVAIIVGVYLFGLFVDWMAETFGAADSAENHRGIALAVYVATPMLVMGVLNLYPAIWFNAMATLVAGAYSVYLLYEGIPILMNIEKERGFLYASAALCVGLVLVVCIRVGSVLMWTWGVGPVYIS